jgi:hypothetical protein
MRPLAIDDKAALGRAKRAAIARAYRAKKRAGEPIAKRGENLRKHGKSGSPEHRAWCGMLTRCWWSVPGDRNYHLYKGANITVCERWRDFENFLADMGKKPSPRHSLDRFPNPAGNYEPGNCRWATAKEQARNWSNRNVLFKCGGEALTLSEWAERLGCARGSLRDRIQAGWSLERALTTPPLLRRERMADGTFASLGD